jgi:hypothetical protein
VKVRRSDLDMKKERRAKRRLEILNKMEYGRLGFDRIS